MWLKDIVDYLRQYLHFPEVDVPQVAEGEEFLRLSMEEVEAAADRCRKHWGLGSRPIPDVILLLESHGVVASRGEYESNKIDAHSEWSTADQTPYTMLGDDKGSAARSRFDAAHELGHHVLHRDVPESLEDKHHKLIENQANRFASAFLLPAESFTQDFLAPDLDVFLNLTDKWKVSVAGQIERCKHLGIVDSSEYKGLRIKLSRRGWIKGEPHDGVMEVEQPRLLNRSFQLIVDEGVLSRHEISNSLPFSNKDVEQLAGLPPGFFDSKVKQLATLRDGEENISEETSSHEEAKIYQLFPEESESGS